MKKSILVRLLSIVCVLCLGLCMVFGLAACSEPAEQTKAVASFKFVDGNIEVTYTDGSTGTIVNNKKDNDTYCNHDKYEVTITGLNGTLVQTLVGDVTKIPDDQCKVAKVYMCADKDCGQLSVEYVDHEEKQVSYEATCYHGTYNGLGCKNCGWVEGDYGTDKLEHNHLNVDKPLEFQKNLLNAGKEPTDQDYVTKINPCEVAWYESVGICQNKWKNEAGQWEACQDIKIVEKPATGHVFDKEALRAVLITEDNQATHEFTYEGECLTCKEIATAVELYTLAAGKTADEYTAVAATRTANDAHAVDYVYSGEIALTGADKFSDDTTSYEVENLVVTAADFEESHYVYKNVVGEDEEVEKVEFLVSSATLIDDYVAGLYTKLYMKTNAAALTCDPDTQLADANYDAVCEFCNKSVAIKVKSAHVWAEEDKIVKYEATEQDDACGTIDGNKHHELWKCTVCGNREVEVADYTDHSDILCTDAEAVAAYGAGSKAVSYNAEYNNGEGRFELVVKCIYCARVTKTAAKSFEAITAETCGTAGTYKVIDLNDKEWTVDVPATGKHVLTSGVYVTSAKTKDQAAITFGDVRLNYITVKDYTSVHLDTAETVVCADDMKAVVICPDCNKSITVSLYREHNLDQEHYQGEAESCTSFTTGDKYCTYGDCANKYAEGNDPYEDGQARARHAFKFVRKDGNNIVVECTRCEAQDEYTITAAANNLARDVKNSVGGKLCEDYKNGESNYNIWTFTYDADGEGAKPAESYTVKEMLDVDSHRYGVYKDMEVDVADRYAAEIKALSHLEDGEDAETCQDYANYSFICPDCDKSVSIKIGGKHEKAPNTENTPASCEEDEHWHCATCHKPTYVVGGEKAKGHNVKFTITGYDVKFECENDGCIWEITVEGFEAKATAGTDNMSEGKKDGENTIAMKDCTNKYYTFAYEVEVDNTDEVYTAGKDYQKYEFEQEIVFWVAVDAQHTFFYLGETTNHVIFQYVYVNGDTNAEIYDANNTAHQGLEVYEGKFCTTCKQFIPVA